MTATGTAAPDGPSANGPSRGGIGGLRARHGGGAYPGDRAQNAAFCLPIRCRSMNQCRVRSSGESGCRRRYPGAGWRCMSAARGRSAGAWAWRLGGAGGRRWKGGGSALDRPELELRHHVGGCSYGAAGGPVATKPQAWLPFSGRRHGGAPEGEAVPAELTVWLKAMRRPAGPCGGRTLRSGRAGLRAPDDADLPGNRWI